MKPSNLPMNEPEPLNLVVVPFVPLFVALFLLDCLVTGRFVQKGEVLLRVLLEPVVTSLTAEVDPATLVVGIDLLIFQLLAGDGATDLDVFKKHAFSGYFLEVLGRVFLQRLDSAQ